MKDLEKLLNIFFDPVTDHACLFVNKQQQQQQRSGSVHDLSTQLFSCTILKLKNTRRQIIPLVSAFGFCRALLSHKSCYKLLLKPLLKISAFAIPFSNKKRIFFSNFSSLDSFSDRELLNKTGCCFD